MLLGNQSLSARKSLATGRDTRSCNGCSGGLGKRERIPFEHSDQKKSSVDESKEQRYSASFFPAMSGVEPPDRNDFSSSSDRRLPFGRNFTATPCNAPANSGYALDSAACSPDSNLSSSSLSESSKVWTLSWALGDPPIPPLPSCTVSYSCAGGRSPLTPPVRIPFSSKRRGPIAKAL